MDNQEHGTRRGRRGFLVGLLAAAGATTAFLATSKARAKSPAPPTAPAAGPILYRPTAETERYYKTLFQ